MAFWGTPPFLGDATKECRCTPGQIQQYLGKISGPLPDRIDIHVEVPAVPYQELRGESACESSAEIRLRVEHTRAVQQARGFYNSRIPARMIRKVCALDDAGERTLETAVRLLGLSAQRARSHSEGGSHHRAPRRIGKRSRQTRRRSGSVSQHGSELLELTSRMPSDQEWLIIRGRQLRNHDVAYPFGGDGPGRWIWLQDKQPAGASARLHFPMEVT